MIQFSVSPATANIGKKVLKMESNAILVHGSNSHDCYFSKLHNMRLSGVDVGYNTYSNSVDTEVYSYVGYRANAENIWSNYFLV